MEALVTSTVAREDIQRVEARTAVHHLDPKRVVIALGEERERFVGAQASALERR